MILVLKGINTSRVFCGTVVCMPGNNVLNFSQRILPQPQRFGGTLAGDVNGAVSTSTLGDDKVNAVDLTAVLAKFTTTTILTGTVSAKY